VNPSFELNLEHPANARVIRYLKKRNEKAPPLQLPDSVSTPYYSLGSHPDIVERVWVQLAARLPSECAVIAYGNPALVHPASGIVMALAMGTAYTLRILPESRDEAVRAGASAIHNYTASRIVLDVSKELGPDWIFGCWDERECEWCFEVYQSLSGTR